MAQRHAFRNSHNCVLAGLMAAKDSLGFILFKKSTGADYRKQSNKH
jgi:hypothetical protein